MNNIYTWIATRSFYSKPLLCFGFCIIVATFVFILFSPYLIKKLSGNRNG